MGPRLLSLGLLLCLLNSSSALALPRFLQHPIQEQIIKAWKGVFDPTSRKLREVRREGLFRFQVEKIEDWEVVAEALKGSEVDSLDKFERLLSDLVEGPLEISVASERAVHRIARFLGSAEFQDATDRSLDHRRRVLASFFRFSRESAGRDRRVSWEQVERFVDSMIESADELSAEQKIDLIDELWESLYTQNPRYQLGKSFEKLWNRWAESEPEVYDGLISKMGNGGDDVSPLYLSAVHLSDPRVSVGRAELRHGQPLEFEIGFLETYIEKLKLFDVPSWEQVSEVYRAISSIHGEDDLVISARAELMAQLRPLLDSGEILKAESRVVPTLLMMSHRGFFEGVMSLLNDVSPSVVRENSQTLVAAVSNWAEAPLMQKSKVYERILQIYTSKLGSSLRPDELEALKYSVGEGYFFHFAERAGARLHLDRFRSALADAGAESAQREQVLEEHLGHVLMEEGGAEGVSLELLRGVVRGMLRMEMEGPRAYEEFS